MLGHNKSRFHVTPSSSVASLLVCCLPPRHTHTHANKQVEVPPLLCDLVTPLTSPPPSPSVALCIAVRSIFSYSGPANVPVELDPSIPPRPAPPRQALNKSLFPGSQHPPGRSICWISSISLWSNERLRIGSSSVSVAAFNTLALAHSRSCMHKRPLPGNLTCALTATN